MNREIKFRGLYKDKWYYGDLVHVNMHRTPMVKETIYHVNDGVSNLIPLEVDPKTICQYTGLKDKNGKEIYEGDILKVPTGSKDPTENPFELAKIEFIEGSFMYNIPQIGYYYMDEFDEESEIIGNIYENHELL